MSRSQTSAHDPVSIGRRKVLSGLTAATAASLLAGCGDGAVFGGGAKTIPPGTKGRAAVLMPLTGRSAGLGHIMREAASLGGDGVGLSAEVEILDSGDSEEAAVKAALAAVDAGAKMIIGPLFSSQARAVVGAVPRGVPVVTLSNDSTLGAEGAFVYGITPMHSAQAVLGLAAGKGLHDIAVVAPDGAFGDRSVAAAQALAGPLGLTLRPPLRTASAAGLLDSLRTAGGGALPQAVYLPNAGAELEALAAALTGAEVQILGSNQWSGSDLEGRQALRGAWFAAPDPLRFEPFLRALADRSVEGVGVVAGLAFDGVEMARLLGRIGEQDRDGLLRDKGFSGVLGTYRFLKTGECQRGLAVLEITDNGLELIGSTGI